MTEELRENYFLIVKTVLLLALEGYILLTQFMMTGVSARVLLLFACMVGVMEGKDLVKLPKNQWLLMTVAVVLWGIAMLEFGNSCCLLGVFLAFEIISMLQVPSWWYGLPVVLACIPGQEGLGNRLMFCLFLALVYIQHDFIVRSYQQQMREGLLLEQHLKHNMTEQENAFHEEKKRNLLQAENQILKERTRLSQTLHDKLGHNINGSVYQLEAIKVLLEKEPETAQNMLQAVINQLRTGMDEIRLILRKERPKKHKLALVQLQELCEECEQKGVHAQLKISGELAEVSETYLEIILDNAYEAVSNSMKYAKCTKIEITIQILNQFVRCSICDNGIGCDRIEDGMGIAGMRRRVRQVNGLLDFETEIGFHINILLPR